MSTFLYKPSDSFAASIKLDRCRMAVSDETSFHFFQCSRKWKETIEGVKMCKQHAGIKRRRIAWRKLCK